MAVYLRKYELVIGSQPKTYAVRTYRPSSPDAIDTSVFTNPYSAGHPALASNVEPKTEYIDFRTIPSGDEALVIRELQIEADITYSSKAEDIKGQMATIRIFNLKKESRDFIKKDGVIFLKGGYENDDTYSGIDQEQDEQTERQKLVTIPLLFCGQIDNVFVSKKGMDIITEITCKDLGFPAKNVKVSKSYRKGSTYEDVINDLLGLAAQNGIPTGFFLSPGNAAAVINSRLVVEGGLLDELSKVCNGIGLQAYIAAGQIYIEPKGKVSRIEVVILYQKNIKSAQKDEKASGETLQSKDTTSGVKITTFLNGNIAINKMLKVVDGHYAGIYKITDVSHNLSYEGGEWDTEVTATRV